MSLSKQSPYMKPPTPFVGSILGGLQEGQSITVAGSVPLASESFKVSLQSGSEKQADIALQFNAKFDKRQGYVVCNTFRNNQWGKDKRKQLAANKRGSNFTLVIIVTRDSYSISVDGFHLLEYKHFLPFRKVDTIAVSGGVQAEFISFENPNIPPSAPIFFFSNAVDWLSSWMKKIQPSLPECHVTPYSCSVPGGMYSGRSVTIQGVIKAKAVRFHIKLCFKEGVAFLFKPEFKEGVVVRNSQLKGAWGHEDQSGAMPLCQGQAFVITITSNSDYYKVFVNGAHFFDYPHRYDCLQSVDFMEVDGDTSVISVEV
ncbi:galectin-9B-like [Brienomyrus brachyistius]|uniref:galectin-9B-like n=1 Tax=Brienomyrus brachyistius TaxID=42636 RepID=UPI0020B27441|nr:galectin-9B-like [Brienomyrus brachyistius]